MPIVTNSTKVLNVATFAHWLSAELFEVCENGYCDWMYPIDFLVFGRPVSVGKEGRANIVDES